MLALIADAAALPQRYEQAKTALAECVEIDECVAWANKAEALRSYTAQAKDETLARYATRIKARAIRRAGQLLEEMEPQRGANQNIRDADDPKVGRRAAAASAGLSPRQQKQAQRVARVPQADFDDQVDSAAPPTITALAALGTARASLPVTTQRDGASVDRSLVAWGTLYDFSSWCARNAPTDIAKGFLEGETLRAIAQAQFIIGWLSRLSGELKNVHDQDAKR